jgi:hypothetical protein
VILTLVLCVTLYSTDDGVTLVICGTGARTVKTPGTAAACPPASGGLRTITW